MQDFKDKKAVHSTAALMGASKPVAPAMVRLNEEKPGWYEGMIDFKRVLLVPGTGKYQYRDTQFIANVKANSGIDCYNRIVDYLRDRVGKASKVKEKI